MSSHQTSVSEPLNKVKEKYSSSTWSLLYPIIEEISMYLHRRRCPMFLTPQVIRASSDIEANVSDIQPNNISSTEFSTIST